jgi:hypothetical protein
MGWRSNARPTRAVCRAITDELGAAQQTTGIHVDPPFCDRASPALPRGRSARVDMTVTHERVRSFAPPDRRLQKHRDAGTLADETIRYRRGVTLAADVAAAK